MQLQVQARRGGVQAPGRGGQRLSDVPAGACACVCLSAAVQWRMHRACSVQSIASHCVLGTRAPTAREVGQNGSTLTRGAHLHGLHTQVRDAFRTLRVPLTLEQVTEFIRKADVLRNNKITYAEFMWAVERADVELTMLIDAGDKASNEQDVVPPAINAISRRKCVTFFPLSSPCSDCSSVGPGVEHEGPLQGHYPLPHSSPNGPTLAPAASTGGSGLTSLLAASQSPPPLWPLTRGLVSDVTTTEGLSQHGGAGGGAGVARRGAAGADEDGPEGHGGSDGVAAAVCGGAGRLGEAAAGERGSHGRALLRAVHVGVQAFPGKSRPLPYLRSSSNMDPREHSTRTSKIAPQKLPCQRRRRRRRMGALTKKERAGENAGGATVRHRRVRRAHLAADGLRGHARLHHQPHRDAHGAAGEPVRTRGRRGGAGGVHLAHRCEKPAPSLPFLCMLDAALRPHHIVPGG